MDVNAFPIIDAIKDAEITRLRAEVEALRADAERYRISREWFCINDREEREIDEEIAARAAQGGEHG